MTISSSTLLAAPQRAGQIKLIALATAVISGLTIGGLGCGMTAQAALPAPSAASHVSLLPTLAGPQEPALMDINGQKLSASVFNNTLTKLYGMNLLRKWMQVTLLRQACQKAGIHIAKSAVDAQEDKVLQQLSAEHVPQGQRHAALARTLAARGISVPQFRLSLWQSAYVKALAKGHIHVTKAQIREAYNVNFGPKVKAVDIVVNSFGEAATVRHLIMRDHKNPEQVATTMSIDPQVSQTHGVIIIPLENTSLPANLLNTAQHLKPGVLSSSIPINGSLHLLWLLEKIPANHVSMRKVKPVIVKKLTILLENQWGAREIVRLWQAAKIKVNNPILARQYKALQAAILAQQAKQHATTQDAPPGK